MNGNPSVLAALREFLGTPNTTVYWDAERIARAFEQSVRHAEPCKRHVDDGAVDACEEAGFCDLCWQSIVSAFVASLREET